MRYSLLLAALLLAACTAGGDAMPSPLWRHAVADGRSHPGTVQVAGQRVLHETVRAESALFLSALDLDTGQLIWEQPFERNRMSSWLAAGERVFYILPATTEAAAGSEQAQSVVALDAATGQPVWRFDDMQVDSALRVHGGCLLVVDSAGELLCVDRSDGRVVSSYPAAPAAELGAAGAAAVQSAFTEDAVYQLSPAGVLRAYDIPQATLAYSVGLAYQGVADALDVQAGHAFVHTRPADKAVPPRPYLMGLPSGRLHVYELPSGRPLWEAQDAGGLREVIALDGRQYALVARPTRDYPDDLRDDPAAGLMVFDLATGQELYSVDARARQSWVSPDGRLVTSIADGKLAAYDLPTGALLWRADSDSDSVVSIEGLDPFVYLTASHDILSSHASSAIDQFEVFDVGSGRRLWNRHAWVQAAAVPGEPRLLAAEIGSLTLYPLAE